nr:phosphatidate cytidylyltransferase, mitochondrial isoform X2 [Malus domestica]
MENHDEAQLQSFLKTLPPVEFCCVYGSSLHPSHPSTATSTMVDCILGVSDPQQWHSENLKLNNDHYASWMVLLGGARLITGVADEIGVGVHFNPFVSWNDKTYKYGVVGMHNLVQDVLTWERFYLSGRLQKPVQEDLYAKICSLSYMGDVRMLFAEDRNKVKKIVQGQFELFQSMYKPFIEEYETKEFLRRSLSGNPQPIISQDCGLSAARSLVSSLPPMIRSQMGMKLGEKKALCGSGRAVHDIVIGSKDEAAKCMQSILRRKVMVSSARQAVAGLIAVGGINGMRYLGAKMSKAWKSWRS